MTATTRLRRHTDERGHLVAVGAGTETPFEVRRVFWIYGNTAALPRAGHANAHTTEMIVCVAGSCRAIVTGDAGPRPYTLDSPDTGLVLPPMTWLDLVDFTPDCILVVLADTPYSPDDAITDPAQLRATR